MLQKYLRSVLAAAAVAALAFSVSSADAAQKKIAFMCPEPVEIKDGKVIGDYGWNQMGAEGALQACKNTGSECEIASGLGYADIRPVLREFATGGFDLIICGRQASDWDNAQVPLGVAEILGMSCITLGRKVEVEGDKVLVERLIPDGYEVVETSWYNRREDTVKATTG